MTVKTRNSLFAIGLSLCLVAGVTLAASPVLQVGELDAHRVRAPLVVKQFERTVHEAVDQLDTSFIKGGPYVLSASLARFETKNGDFGLQATAIIETSFRHERTGNLIGTTCGTATAAAPGGSLSDAQNTALRAAAESALKDIPAALSKTQR